MKVRNPIILYLVLCLAVSVLAQTAQSAGAGPAKPQDRPTGESNDAQDSSNPGDPLLDVPPLPKGHVSVVGGTVEKIDQIRNRLVVEPFGGGEKLKLNFDERTHIYRDGTETTQTVIQKGDRVYVDTMLDGARLFARNIRVHSQVGPADASGQIQDLNVRNGLLTLRDQLSAEPVTFRVDSSTVVKRDNQRQALADVKNGSLVTVKFAPGGRSRGLVKEIAVIAVPGTSFTFAGKVTHLDLSQRLLAIQNLSDGNTYDIAFDPNKVENKDNLGIGVQVIIVATFTGSGYTAESITINPETATQQ